MNRISRIGATGISVLGLVLASSSAISQQALWGTIYYSPVASIPTLSGPALVALAFLVGMLAYRILRSHSIGKPLATLVATGILAAGMASGNHLVKNAQATLIPVLSLSSSSGGQIDTYTPGLHQVTNTSGTTLRITDIYILYRAPITPYSPECFVGTVLQDGDSCYINFSD